MRTQIEALGKPTDTPIEKIYPQSAKIGRAFVKQIKRSSRRRPTGRPPRLMIKQFGYYFDGLALGYAVLEEAREPGRVHPDRRGRRREPRIWPRGTHASSARRRARESRFR